MISYHKHKQKKTTHIHHELTFSAKRLTNKHHYFIILAIKKDLHHYFVFSAKTNI